MSQRLYDGHVLVIRMDWGKLGFGYTFLLFSLEMRMP